MMNLKVEVGDIVEVEYTGKLENGEVFGTSDKEIAKEAGIYASESNFESLVVKVGSGRVIKGLDKALVGMEKGEEKEITISPENGYGYERPELLLKMPMSAFRKSGIEPHEGMRISTAKGTAKVMKVLENEVEVNFNHPLAGKTLIFEIKVEDIKKVNNEMYR